MNASGPRFGFVRFPPPVNAQGNSQRPTYPPIISTTQENAPRTMFPPNVNQPRVSLNQQQRHRFPLQQQNNMPSQLQRQNNMPSQQQNSFCPQQQNNFPSQQNNIASQQPNNIPSQQQNNFPTQQPNNFPAQQNNFCQLQPSNFPSQQQNSFSLHQQNNCPKRQRSFPPEQQNSFPLQHQNSFPSQQQNNFPSKQQNNLASNNIQRQQISYADQTMFSVGHVDVSKPPPNIKPNFSFRNHRPNFPPSRPQISYADTDIFSSKSNNSWQPGQNHIRPNHPRPQTRPNYNPQWQNKHQRPNMNQPPQNNMNQPPQNNMNQPPQNNMQNLNINSMPAVPDNQVMLNQQNSFNPTFTDGSNRNGHDGDVYTDWQNNTRHNQNFYQQNKGHRHPWNNNIWNMNHQNNRNKHEKQKFNTKKQKIDKRDLPENNVYFCDTCDRGYKDEDKYQEHINSHVQCHHDGCSYTAHPKLVKLHDRVQHSNGLASKIWSLESEEDIKKWREERRRNFPTAENIQKKMELEAKKIARGEVVETKTFGKMKTKKTKGMSWKERKRERQRNKRNFKAREENGIQEKANEEISRDIGNISTMNQKGKKQTELEGDPLSLLIKSEEATVNNESEPPLPQVGGLGMLMATYTDSEEEPYKNPLTGNSENETICSPPEEKVKPTKNERRRPRKRKRAKKSQENPNVTPPKVRKSTLLEKLLAPEIRHERNVVLQCVHYIVKNNFFGKVPNGPKYGDNSSSTECSKPKNCDAEGSSDQTLQNKESSAVVTVGELDDLSKDLSNSENGKEDVTSYHLEKNVPNSLLKSDFNSITETLVMSTENLIDDGAWE